MSLESWDSLKAGKQKQFLDSALWRGLLGICFALWNCPQNRLFWVHQSSLNGMVMKRQPISCSENTIFRNFSKNLDLKTSSFFHHLPNFYIMVNIFSVLINTRAFASLKKKKLLPHIVLYFTFEWWEKNPHRHLNYVWIKLLGLCTFK